MAECQCVLGFPKYSLAASVARDRRVLLVAPASSLGARLLLESGAREVLAVGASESLPEGIQARKDGLPVLPLHDRSVDIVLLDDVARRCPEGDFEQILEEAFRVVAPDGHVFADVQMEGVRAFGGEQPRAPGPDFWELESSLAARAGSTQLFAQLSWQGFALSPVLDDDAEERSLSVELDESALEIDVEPARFVMVAGAAPLPQTASDVCLLVALPEAVLEIHRPPAKLAPEVEDELSRLRDALGVRAAKNAALQRSNRELEAHLTALRARPTAEDPGKIQQLRETIEAQRMQLEASHGRLERVAEEQALTQKSTSALRVFSERTAQELARVTDECAVLKTEGEQSRRELDKIREAKEDLSYELDRARTELDVLEQVARDQERALKSASTREREHRGDWEEARAEVVSLRASMEHLRDERDELRREFDELVAIHQRAEHELQRAREELRVTSRRSQERTREYEARIDELEHLRARLDEVQHQLGQVEEENFRLRTSQTSARELAGGGHLSEELSRERDRLRSRLSQRGEELHALEREALARRMDVARLELALERSRREQDRLRGEVARARGIDGPADSTPVPMEGDAAGVVSGPHLDRVEQELDGARAEVERLQGEVARLERTQAAQTAEIKRRADREEVLAGMVERLEADDERDSEEDAPDGPILLGDDGLPARWPEEARKRIRRLERRLKFGGDAAVVPSSTRVDPALEAKVRAAEQAHLIGRLEAAEQVIWEMSDTSDRNAAQYEASVAELRRERENRQAALDELEVLRRLLGTERDRSLERERLLSDARARLAARVVMPEQGGPASDVALVDLGAHDRGDADLPSESAPAGDA